MDAWNEACRGPNQKESIELGYLKRLADKKWRIRYDVPSSNDGRRKQKAETLVNVTKPQAEAILADRKRGIVAGEYIPEDLTVTELFARFVQSKSQLAPTTAQRYHGLFETYLNPRFGKARIESIKQVQLARAYWDWQREGRNGRKVSARTIRHVHDLVRNLLSWAVRMEYASRNVAKLLTADDIPKAERPEIRFLNELELRRLLSMAEQPTSRSKKRGTLSSQPWFFAAVAFAAYTGARRGEVLAVRWSDLDLKRLEVTIRKSLTQTHGGLRFKSPKNGRSRRVAVPTKLIAILCDHQAKQKEERETMGAVYKDDDLIFALADGSPVTPWNFGAAFRDLVKRTGLKGVTLHSLRHTHVTLLGRAGVSLKVASERAGHSTVSFTGDRYSHVFRSDDAAAASAFERLVG